MKILVVFYSRTDNTRKVAEEIKNSLDCDIEEIIDTQNRSGPLGYMRSGRDASRGKLTILKD
ncbi:MAG: flavodoxin family protein, partial [Methanobacterium sp.]